MQGVLSDLPPAPPCHTLPGTVSFWPEESDGCALALVGQLNL
jgi:hypothetical protein